MSKDESSPTLPSTPKSFDNQTDLKPCGKCKLSMVKDDRNCLPCRESEEKSVRRK